METLCFTVYSKLPIPILDKIGKVVHGAEPSKPEVSHYVSNAQNAKKIFFMQMYVYQLPMTKK